MCTAFPNIPLQHLSFFDACGWPKYGNGYCTLEGLLMQRHRGSEGRRTRSLAQDLQLGICGLDSLAWDLRIRTLLSASHNNCKYEREGKSFPQDRIWLCLENPSLILSFPLGPLNIQIKSFQFFFNDSLVENWRSQMLSWKQANFVLQERLQKQ